MTNLVKLLGPVLAICLVSALLPAKLVYSWVHK